MRRWVAAAAAVSALGVLAVVAVPLLVVAALLGSAQSAQACAGQPAGAPAGSADSAAPAAVRVTDLSLVQLGNAGAWVAEGERLGVPAQGIVVGLATISQESGFLNYANDGLGADLAPDQRDVARSLRLAHDAVGSDHGSVGLAQQQYPWWGTLEELMHPPTAAGKFYRALLAVPGWESMPVTESAQRVQRSLYPGAYADDEPLARELLAHLAGVGAAVGPGLCGTGAALDCPPTGLGVEAGLTPDALRVLRCVHQRFGDHAHDYGGVGEDNPGSEHPAGRAVDVGIGAWDTPAGNAAGGQVARWVAANAPGLGVTYVVWDARIWSARRAAQGWRPYPHPSGRSTPTLEHRDHVHVSVHGDAAGEAGGVSGAGWTLPLPAGSYRLSSGYGPRLRRPTGRGSAFHSGLDFAAPTATPVRAAAAGQVIGAVGATGNTTGAHLHFEVRVRGAGTDPAGFLRRYGVDPGRLR